MKIIKLGIIAACLFLTAPQQALAYRVGVDYHATTDSMDTGPFLAKYHQPEVRALVLSQLHGMADSGAEIISTRIWLTDLPNAPQPNLPARWGFPPTTQQLANLRQYAQDVSSITTVSGKPLDLYITFLWNGCGNYGNYELWNCFPSWESYRDVAKQSVTLLFDSFGDLTRADGKKAVSLVYFDGEVMYIAKKNTDRMYLDVYPHFIATANSKGISPSLYFVSTSSEKEIMSNQYGVEGDFQDAEYPILNGHQSMYWMYRTTEFLRRNNLYLPQRLDVSFYPTRDTHDYYTLVSHVMKDLRAIYPNNTFAIAETAYPTLPADRLSLGQAFIRTNQELGAPVELTFWTTPDADGWGKHFAYPFDIKSYLPIVAPTSPTNLAVSSNTITWSPGLGGNPQYLRVGTDQAVVKDGCPNGIGGTTGCFFKSEALATSLSTFTLPTSLLPGTLYYWQIANSDGNIMKDAIISITSTGSPSNRADISGKDGSPDGTVDAYDYTPIDTDYGKLGAPGFSIADISGKDGIPDGTVSMYDYSFFVSNFGK